MLVSAERSMGQTGRGVQSQPDAANRLNPLVSEPNLDLAQGLSKSVPSTRCGIGCSGAQSPVTLACPAHLHFLAELVSISYMCLTDPRVQLQVLCTMLPHFLEHSSDIYPM